METKKYISGFFKGKTKESKKTAIGMKEGAKVFAVSIIALLAFGFFTSSRRINAG